MNNQQRITEIERRLMQALDPEQLSVIDESDQHIGHAGARSGHGHFALVICAKVFNGKNEIERHRLVYSALADLMKTDIHALSIKASAPGE